MAFNKIVSFNFLLLTLLFCFAKNSFAMQQTDKENQVTQTLAMVKAQQIHRPSTPLDPENFLSSCHS